MDDSSVVDFVVSVGGAEDTSGCGIGWDPERKYDQKDIVNAETVACGGGCDRTVDRLDVATLLPEYDVGKYAGR